jgi:enolase
MIAPAQGRIARLRLRRIFDSRGNPTVEAEIWTDRGERARAASPSGASRGAHEVAAFPSDGVEGALQRFRERVQDQFVGHALGDQAAFDSALREADGTPDLSNLGGNTTTALSLAYALATAGAQGLPLWRSMAGGTHDPPVFPALVGNVLNGGVHAVGGPDIQEYLVLAEAPEVAWAVEGMVAVHREVGRRLRERFPHSALGRGDEGGWVSPLGNLETLELLMGACQTVQDRGLRAGLNLRPGLDLAASEFFREGRYVYREQTLDREGQIGFVVGLTERFGLAYLEDPLDQEDFAGFAELTSRVGRGGRTWVVGDDLYTTDPGRVARGMEMRSTNAVLLKVNQVGTLTETRRVVERSEAAGAWTVCSHRSGETPDPWLAHLPLAFGSRGLKTGVLGGERMAKLNELVRLRSRES